MEMTLRFSPASRAALISLPPQPASIIRATKRGSNFFMIYFLYVRLEKFDGTGCVYLFCGGREEDGLAGTETDLLTING